MTPMKPISFRRLLLISLVGLLLLIPAVSQAQQEPAVRAVLFYSPTCPHCHQVINEVLLPLVEEHGSQLQIVAVDVTQAGGQSLYESTIDHFEIPEDRLGVPTLIVGDTVMVGSGEIPAQFPAIVRQGLAAGIDWPAIPGFVPPIEAAEASAGATMTPGPVASATPQPTATAEPAVGEETIAAPVAGQDDSEAGPTRATQSTAGDAAPLVLDGQGQEIVFEDPEDPPADPAGFTLASIILVAMLAACIYVARQFIMPVATGGFNAVTTAPGLSWAIPLVAVLGIGVAAYLAYVEVNQVAAVCGPVGHCNLVQSSAYALIVGVPIAILGIVSYVAITALWLAQLWLRRDAQKRAARTGLVGLAIVGTLFSIYLTVLELFVIRAVCAWCLSSAVFMAVIMVLAARPATQEPELAFR